MRAGITIQPTRRRTVLIPLVLAVVGCPSGTEPADTGGDTAGTDCTTDARASLQLSIVDSDGAPISGATGTYATADVPETPCDAGYGEDNLLICGWEVSGELTVTVQADGYGDVSDTWTVLSDACHVETVHDSVAMASITTGER